MKRILCLLTFLGLVAPGLAAENGLYDISDRAHPRLLHEQIEKVTMASTANDNRHFFLQLSAPQAYSVPCERLGLILGTNLIKFNGYGQDSQGYTMDASVEDPEIAQQIAAYFHVTVTERRHPGQQMLVEFIPDQAKFAPGEPVLVKLRITNIGKTAFSYMQGGRQRGARDNQFAFTAEYDGNKMLPDTGEPMNFGGLEFAVLLKPNERHELTVDLTQWFKFKPGGIYILRGSYLMDFVAPHSENMFTIWEDYACGEFMISIKN